MPHEDKPAGHQAQTGHLEKEELRLWRLALWFLVLLAIGFAALAWERLQNLPYHLGLVALGLVAVAVLFAVYVYGRRRQVSELRGLLDGLEKGGGMVPSEEQLDQLSQVLARSQRSFKELIDAFDDVAFAASLDGTLRTVNRRVTQLLGLSYSESPPQRRKRWHFSGHLPRRPRYRGQGHSLPRYVGGHHRTPENGRNAPPTGGVPAISARKFSRSDFGHRPE
jgi:PAS domain-containing protein